MRVLTATNHPITRELWRRYPDHTGCLISPGRASALKEPIPYVLDNGAFSVWKNGGLFEPLKFMKYLEFYASQAHQPLWVAVPDVVADAEATSRQWIEWFPVIKDFGFKTAFVIQDGHQLHDVPENADFVFVGGSDCWKWWAVKEFCPRFPCHVGRVNGKRIWFAYCAGAQSCDGSGWFRGDQKQLQILLDYLKFVNLDIEDFKLPAKPFVTQKTLQPIQLNLFDYLNTPCDLIASNA